MNRLAKGAARTFCPAGGRRREEVEEDEEDAGRKSPLPHSDRGEGGRDVYLEESPMKMTVNGEEVTIDTSSATATTSLARYLRSQLRLTGTKIMCAQAGCGACLVTAKFVDPATGETKTRSVNSCTTPILKCEGWEVTTVEGLGSETDGLHPIQEMMAEKHASQCGMCTPGMIMAMNSLLENDPSPDVADIEDLLDGNICRCTGYRPIFDALRTFSGDGASAKDRKKIEAARVKGNRLFCPKSTTTSKAPSPTMGKKRQNRMQYVATEDGEWMRPESLDELLALIDDAPAGSYRLVCGNTGVGVYPDDGPYASYFDVNAIPDLFSVTTDGGSFLIGASVSLSDFASLLAEQASLMPEQYSYCQQMASHMKKVANTNVRNVGSVGGNLMLKHSHVGFASDIFNLLEAVGARIAVMDTARRVSLYSPLDWIGVSMDKKIAYFIEMPELTQEHTLRAYKVAMRSQNAKSIVNSAFLARTGTDFVVTETPSLLYGGVASGFTHASATEAYLVGKSLASQDTLEGALSLLDGEVVPDDDPASTSSEYRRHLVKALFYKFVLHILGEAAPAELRSGSSQLTRGVSTASHDIGDTNDSDFPIGEPIQKLEAHAQCTGEAEYVDDIPPDPQELFAAYVLTSIGNCDLAGVDSSAAMAMPGVVSFVDATDIPSGGVNSVTGVEAEPPRTTEEIFCSGRVHYAGQAVGLIVADTYEHARDAAAAVVVEYENLEQPVLTIQQALENQGKKPMKPTVDKKHSGKNGRALRTISSNLEVGSQYHFHMEHQSCIVRPIEDGQFDVISATQWMQSVQVTCANALGIAQHKINVTVRRLGGGYGGKIYKPRTVAGAAAVAANKLKLPVRLVLDLQTNMELMGKRSPFLFNYEATVDEDTLKLTSVSVTSYSDEGFSGIEPEAGHLTEDIQNCYHVEDGWTSPLTDEGAYTNTATNTPVRAPHTTQNHACIEHVMEHVATVLGADPLEFRINNLLTTGDPLLDGSGDYEEEENPLVAMIDQLKQSGEYDARKTEVATFNAENRWMKRGLSLVPLRWRQRLSELYFSCQVAVYKEDGSVSVSHGGIEMGQGINTKVAQVVAGKLGIAVDDISVKPSNNFIGNNNSLTGASYGSEMACSAAQIACQELLDRMQPVVDTLEVDATWLEKVQACYDGGVDLTGRHMTSSSSDGTKDYDLHLAVLTEVEVDVLTGEKTVRRSDVLAEVGDSVSPEVDIGQVEGGFVFGLGLWLTEEIRHDPDTGRLLTYDSWTYKPPASQDIPETLNTAFYNTGSNDKGVLGSKATGEPAMLGAVSSVFAIRQAVNSVKADLGVDTAEWYQMNGPVTNEVIQLTTGVTSDAFSVV